MAERRNRRWQDIGRFSCEKEPQKEPNVPTSGSSMKKSEPKKVNEEFESFLSERISKLWKKLNLFGMLKK